jgi:hypothetical protein
MTKQHLSHASLAPRGKIRKIFLGFPPFHIVQSSRKKNMNARWSVFAIVVLLSLLCAMPTYAQRESQTILLKDGSVVRGVITRTTADTLDVTVADSTIRIPTSAIRRIRNEVSGTREQPQDSVQPAPAQPVHGVEDAFRVWEITAGVAIPQGEFTSTNTSAIGFASMGACLGVQYRIDLERGFEVGAKMVFDYYPFNRNAFDSHFPGGAQLDVGSWYLFWTLAGAGFHIPVAANERFHVAGLVGYSLGFSPKVNVTYGPLWYSQTSSSASGLAYGGEFGFYGRGLDIEVRYLATSIEYSFKTSSGSAFNVRQPTAAFQVTLGVAFL